MSAYKKKKYFFVISLIALVCCLVFTPSAKAQLWQPVAPYNVLWPLFSPALSYTNPVTGLKTPNVSYLDTYTDLPQEPSFVWDWNLPYFYILYNEPATGKVVYYDPLGLLTGTTITGFSYWPPPGYTTPWGAPDPIVLPLNYSNLISFDPAFFLEYWIPTTNQKWTSTFGYYPYPPYYLLPASALVPVGFTYTGYYY